jgi:hypothetical protein
MFCFVIPLGVLVFCNEACFLGSSWKQKKLKRRPPTPMDLLPSLKRIGHLCYVIVTWEEVLKQGKKELTQLTKMHVNPIMKLKCSWKMMKDLQGLLIGYFCFLLGYVVFIAMMELTTTRTTKSVILKCCDDRL